VAGNLWGNIQQESSHVTEIVKHLINSGFSPKLCAQIARNLPDDFNTQQLIKNAREQVKCLIKTSRAFDIFDRGGVFAFIGPTGVGKTTTVATIAQTLKAWRIQPSGSLGYSKAEVTLGGVDTQELAQQTMMARRAPGLYFIGEVVDVTGWLGGYNFQWAWSSGYVAGMAA
jgi:flagellar biosynthesis GTPase FlhF